LFTLRGVIMRLVLRRLSILSALAAAPLMASAPVAQRAPAAAADGELRTRLDDIDRRAGQAKDLTARFEQQKFTALLKKPLVSSGKVRTKGSVVRWDTEAPEPAVLHSDGREIRMYYPRQKVVEVYPIDRRLTDLASSPLPRLAALREHFQIDKADLKDVEALQGGGAQSGEGSGPRIALRLTPTDELLKQHVDRVMVLLDADAACVVGVEVDDADGDRTVMRFSDVKLNAGLKDADVALALPPGTKVSRPLEGARADQQGPRGRLR